MRNFRDVLVTAGGLVLQQLTLFAVGFYVAHHIGAADYGSLSIARSIMMVVLTFAPLGLDLALLKHLPIIEQTNGSVYRHFRRYRLIAFCASTALTLLLVALAPTLQTQVYDFDRFGLYFAATILALPFMADIQLFGAYFRAIGRPATYAIVTSYFQSLLRAALNLTAVWIGLGALGVAASTSFSAAVASAVATLFMIRLNRQSRPATEASGPDRASVLNVLGEGKWMAANLFVAGLARSSDTVILGLFAPAEQVGAYAALSLVAYVIAVYPMALSQTMGPEVARLFSERRLADITTLQNSYIANASVASGFIFGGIALFGPRLDLLLGGSFTFPPLLCLLLPLGYLIFGVLGPMGYALSMTGRHREELAVLSGGSIVLVGLLFWLSPLYGPSGAAAATALAFVLTNVARFLLVARHIGRAPGRLFDLVPPLVALAVAWSGREIGDRLMGPELIGSIIGCVAYALLFAVIAWFAFIDRASRATFVAKIVRKS